MSKKLNTALATMLLLSSVAPLASAETVTEQGNEVIKVDQEVPLQVIPPSGEDSPPDETSKGETTSTPETEQSQAQPQPPDNATQEEPEAETKPQEEVPDTTLPTADDIEVDLTKKPHKDGIHLEIRYSSRDEKTAKPHIPSFKVAIVDTKGNPQGTIEANKSNYDVAAGMYNLVIPHDKGLKVGEEFVVHFYDADPSVTKMVLKETYTKDNLYYTDEYDLDPTEHHRTKMTVVTYEDENGKMTLDYAYGKMAPLEGYIETNQDLLLLSLVDTAGNPIKSSNFTLEFGSKKKPQSMKVKTDNKGYAYIDSKKLTDDIVTIKSDKYSTIPTPQVKINRASSEDGKLAMTQVQVTSNKVYYSGDNSRDHDKENNSYGTLKINTKATGNDQLSSTWKEVDLKFKSKTGEVFTQSITSTSDLKNLAPRLKKGVYTVTATSPYANVKLSSNQITIEGNKQSSLDINLTPIYTLEISKDGKDFSYVFMNVQELTDKVQTGKAPIVYGVTPGEAYIVRDKADNKEYTAVIKEGSPQTKLVLGVGTVFGGEVSTPHTGDNIVFLVALFLTCLIAAGVSFYFYKSPKRVKNATAASVIILALLGSMLPTNVAKASDTIFINIGNGTSSGSGSSGGSYTQTPRGAIQVHSNYSLMAVTMIAETAEYLNNNSTEESIKYNADSIFGRERLAYTFYVAANKASYDKAKASNTSFMTYDSTRGALVPIWGTSNTVIDVSQASLTKNQAAVGVKNNAFGTRVLPYIYSDYAVDGKPNDFAFMMGSLIDQLGTSDNSKRHFWTGKDILGNHSSSKQNIGDGIQLNVFDKYMVMKEPKYNIKRNAVDPLALNTLIDPFKTLVAGTSTKAKTEWFNESVDWGNGSSFDSECEDNGDGTSSCSSNAGGSEQSTQTVSLVYQMVNAVYESGSATGPMTFIPTTDLTAWFHDSMRKYNVTHRNKNYHRLDMAKMVYNASQNPNLRGSNDARSFMTAPTKTFIGNVEGTTAKALVPVSDVIGKRPTDTAASVNKNPFSGWGYTFFTSDKYKYYGGSQTPEIIAFLEYTAKNEDGEVIKQGRVPWKTLPEDKNRAFLSSLTQEEQYFKQEPVIVDGKYQYEIQEGTTGKLTLKDVSDKESLFKEDATGAFKLDPKAPSGIESYEIEQLPEGGFALLNRDLPKYADMNNYLKTDNKTMQSFRDNLAVNPGYKLKRNDKTTSKYPLEGVTHDFEKEGDKLGTTYSNAEVVLAVELILKGCTNGGLIEDDCKLPEPGEANDKLMVPEWRLSEYFEDSTPKTQSDAYATITPPGKTWDSPILTNSGFNTFELISPELDEVPWAESVAKLFNGDTPDRDIPVAGGTFKFQLGGDLLAIKDNTTVTNTKLAAWKNTTTAVSPKVGSTFKGEKEPSGKSSITKKHKFIYKVKFPYSEYLYSELIVVCGENSCWKERTTPVASPLDYIDSVNNVTVTFKRYNPKEGVALNKYEAKKDNENGYYWETYQDEQVIKVNPEVSMTVDDKNGNSTSTISAGDREREIKPVHYNSVNFENVKIVPKVDGMSTATDQAAKALASKLGVPALDVIYKGASTSVNFEADKEKSEIVLRTFALDIGSKALKTQWGNTTYETDPIRDEFLGRFATKDAEGKWSIKPVQDGWYVINSKQEGGVKETKTIKQKDYKVIEHTLVVRGGKLQSVNGEKDLSKIEGDLKEAIAKMELTSERGKNVFNQFEYQKGEIIKEQKSIDLINKARENTDLQSGKPWYHEDTTTLIIREYVTSFELPSYMYVDKIPQEIQGIATPMDKQQYFKDNPKSKAGYVGYAKYRITLNEAWMEYDSSQQSPFGGEHAKLYTVPNVSVVDTMQMQ